MNKYILFLVLFSSFLKAEDIKNQQVETNSIEIVNSNNQNYDSRINSLDIELEKLKVIQKELHSNFSRNIKFQNEVQKSSKELMKLMNAKKNDFELLRIELIQPVNHYIYVLPLVTIFIVIASAIVSLKTIKIKSQESLDALNNSNKNQILISQNNHDAERLRSQEEILSNSRRMWINDLRNDISLLVSNLTQHFPATPEQKRELFPLIWNEYYKVQLLLNPKEDLHNELIDEIRTIISFCKADTTATTEDFLNKRKDILAISKNILKLEWDRVKSFV